MVNSELVATLCTLTKQEQTRLKHFLQSPYFTEGKDAPHEIRLAEEIFTALSAGKAVNGALDREVLYAKIYPESKKFVPSTISNLATSTLNLVRKFFVAEMYGRIDQPLHDNTHILNFLLEKGAYDLCEKYLRKAELKKTPKTGPDNLSFLFNWQFENAKGIFLGMKSRQNGDFNLKKSLSALEEFYLIERLDTLTSIFNLNRFTPVLQKKERDLLIAEIDQWANKSCFKNPIVQLSRKALLFLDDRSPQAEKEFGEFMLMLSKHEKTLSLYHLKRMEAFAYNFCTKRFEQQKFRDMLFDLYRRRMKPERLSKESTIQAAEFLSMVKTGLLKGEIKLVQSLLDTFRNRIKGPQASEKYYQFCLAMLHFKQGKFDEAEAIVFQLNFHDSMYKFAAKALEIKLIYEATKNYSTQMDSKLNAFKSNISRQPKITADKLKGFRNFVNLMIRLNHWHMQLKKNWRLLWRMLQEVQKSDSFAERIWLEEKLTTLLGDAPPGHSKK